MSTTGGIVRPICLSRVEIDDQLKLRWLLNWEISGLAAFENLVHIGSGAPVQVGHGHAVGHKPAGFHVFSIAVNRREPALYREFCSLCSVRIGNARQQTKDCVSTPLACGSERSINILGTEDFLKFKLHLQRCRGEPKFFYLFAMDMVEVERTATRESLGRVSLRSSSCLPPISGARVDSPVMFPRGWARLATIPSATGSGSFAMTIGIVEVACLATRVAGPPPVTMTSTLRRTSSAASTGRRSYFPSACRYSMTMFFSSTYPSSRRPRRNASVRGN